MRGLWNLIEVGLVLVGLLIALAGMLWYRTARLFQVFGKPANADRGFWLVVAGFLMLGAGLAFIHFDR